MLARPFCKVLLVVDGRLTAVLAVPVHMRTSSCCAVWSDTKLALSLSACKQEKKKEKKDKETRKKLKEQRALQ